MVIEPSTDPERASSNKPSTVSRRVRRYARWTAALAVGAFALGVLILMSLSRLIAPPPPLPPLSFPYPYVASPNCDDRPPGATVNCVVLHATVLPTTESTVRAFGRKQSGVSAHFVVGKEGRVVQMVPVERRAWHAGISELYGEAGTNAFSVGIEIVNRNDGRDPYPDAQLEAIAGIIRFLRSRYAIPDDRIVSHAEVARPPGRKTDPLGLDFDRIRALCRMP